VLHQLSWIDKRLVRVGHISRCGGVQALALYLLLVTVADSQGLNYYSDKTAARLLGLSEVDCQIRSSHQERGLNFAQIARELHLDHREAPRDRQDLFRIRSPFCGIVTSTTFNSVPFFPECANPIMRCPFFIDSQTLAQRVTILFTTPR
jgi:hypothetical protein